MSKVLRVLQDRKEVSGILALDEPGVLKADSDFLKFLGVEETSNSSVVEAKASALLKPWGKKFKARWVVRLPKDVSETVSNDLKAAGWKLVTVIQSFGDLMEVDGIAEFTEGFKNRMADEKVKLEQLIALLKAAGRVVDAMPDAVTKDQVIFSVLGK
jgi:hypothetical protein